ncbi:Spermidine Putrescine ABC transporter permease component potC [Pseudonocardia sp. Ae406_Ps2]|uniref:ABC transporter permease n=1 Tax=unclassified Pseudonocardia TaxID=2619320 RepID=UPI00094A9CDF|nr:MULTISPECIES: ABC transporter permease [unclassified Pseudonocardia]OLL97891.1 Spermidine Putrescine ABC transporter permease component potC [Pseudonocardia sp. Ae331_Ps2]OLM04400.1 Spermidine Putrescine ABC transporter permease component potC [Pseudonocardia sp. Ae406_Ps2]OLM10764.1 Spermidine Putrescine ABC transporter permease component potC [Pseudonocardia sp. Ae505_Ps2]OLM25962.1 Spermidine Putrescine ABC transporter permease component potC [Pseudonocardia sp. Ae706_Ps2]OLM33911.1 Sper
MTRRPVLTVLAAVAVFFLLFPIVVVVGIAVTAGTALAFPPEGLSLRWFTEAVSYEPFRSALGTSLVVAVFATVLALVVGVPATYAIHRRSPRGRTLLQTLFLSPLIVPELVLSFALFQFFVVQAGIDTLSALVVGHAVLLLPYTVRVTGASLLAADPALEEAATGLGAGPLTTFFRITLPVIAPGVVAASILSVLTSFNNVPLSLMLTSRRVETLPVAMLSYVQTSFTPMVAAASTLLLVFAVAVALVTERLVGFQKVFGRSSS